MKTYSHLSLWERERISLLRAEGICVAEIAAALDRHPGTIYRELGRNSNGDASYRPVSAEGRYLARRQIADVRSIHDRSEEVENRETVGRWEGDLMIANGPGRSWC